MTEREIDVPDRDRWRLDIIEGRRAQADSFTWAVPGLAIAGQAFLLSIVLRPDVTATGRFLVSIAGLAAAIAATHLYAKQVYLFDLYEGFLEAERQRLHLPGIQLDELRSVRFPGNTTYAQRNWDARERWRYRLIVRWKSGNVWMLALSVFVVLNVLLCLYSLIALVGANPHWLG